MMQLLSELFSVEVKMLKMTVVFVVVLTVSEQCL